MSTEPYTPDETELIGTWVDAHRSEAGGGRADKSGEVRERSAEARRGIAKIKADAWDEGAAYVNSPFGIEPGMRNPYRAQEEASD